MWTRVVVVAALVAFSSPAFAEGTEAAEAVATPKARAPRRQAEKLDQERTAALKAIRKVHLMDTVYVFARPQRPLASVETAAQKVRFPVGTARYSERDRRFLKSARGEGW